MSLHSGVEVVGNSNYRVEQGLERVERDHFLKLSTINENRFRNMPMKMSVIPLIK